MAQAGAGVKVDIRPVSSLLPHEETIPSHVELLAAELEEDGVQKDPVLVDQSSGAVLDGMHRLAALAKIGITNVVCASLDYSSKSIGLHRWARSFSPAPEGAVISQLHEAGITRDGSFSDAMESLDMRDSGLGAFVGEGAWLPDKAMDLQEAFAIVRKIDSAAQALGWRRSFIPEDEFEASMRGQQSLILLVRRLGKDDVVAAAKSRSLFPCKTSMHTVDPRPVAVNLPLTELNKTTGEELRKRLANSEGQMLPENSTYDGRRYKERLLLLNPR